MSHYVPSHSLPLSVSWSDLRDRTLQFSVYDFDRFSRNDLIGQVVLRGVADHCDPGGETEYLMDILNTRHVSTRHQYQGRGLPGANSRASIRGDGATSSTMIIRRQYQRQVPVPGVSTDD